MKAIPFLMIIFVLCLVIFTIARFTFMAWFQPEQYIYWGQERARAMPLVKPFLDVVGNKGYLLFGRIFLTVIFLIITVFGTRFVISLSSNNIKVEWVNSTNAQ